MLYAVSRSKADYSHDNQARMAMALESSQQKMLTALAMLPAVTYEVLVALNEVTRSPSALASRVIRAVTKNGERFVVEEMLREDQIQLCENIIREIENAYNDVVGEHSLFAVDHGFAMLNRRILANTLASVELYDRFLQRLATEHGSTLEKAERLLGIIKEFCLVKVQLPKREVEYLTNSSEMLSSLEAHLPARARKYGLKVSRKDLHDITAQVRKFQARHHITLFDAVTASVQLKEGIAEFKAALDRMVSNNMALVMSTVSKRFYQSEDDKDLLQEAVAGLMRACVLFDHRRGYSFATFAGPWIKQAITRTCDSAPTVCMPDRMMVLKRTIQRLDNQSMTSTGSILPAATVAKDLNIDAPQVTYLRGFSTNTSSLNQSFDDDDRELIDLVASEDQEFNPEESCNSIEVRETLEEILSQLNAREQYIVRSRFGFNGKESTLDDLADALGISIERVRQIEQKAISRLAIVADQYGLSLEEMIS